MGGGERTVGPLELGSSSSAAAVGAVRYVRVDPVDLDARVAYAVDANEPGAFLIRFDVVNRGRVPLTFAEPPSTEGLEVTSGVRISSEPTLRDHRAGADVELDGVTMEPGEIRRLTVTYRWKSLCEPNEPDGGGGFLQIGGVPLRYGWHGIGEREQTVEPPHAVVFICGPLPRPDGHWVMRGEARVPGR